MSKGHTTRLRYLNKGNRPMGFDSLIIKPIPLRWVGSPYPYYYKKKKAGGAKSTCLLQD
ncbi:MAG: hypothetical protein WCN64_08490 [Planctomycetota bacterium]